MTEQQENRVAALKVGAAWGGAGVSKWLAAIGITSWSDFSGMVASFVSILIAIEVLMRLWRRARRDDRERKVRDTTGAGDL